MPHADRRARNLSPLTDEQLGGGDIENSSPTSSRASSARSSRESPRSSPRDRPSRARQRSTSRLDSRCSSFSEEAEDEALHHGRSEVKARKSRVCRACGLLILVLAAGGAGFIAGLRAARDGSGTRAGTGSSSDSSTTGEGSNDGSSRSSPSTARQAERHALQELPPPPPPTPSAYAGLEEELAALEQERGDEPDATDSLSPPPAPPLQSLAARLDGCAKRIPGWFAGRGIYETAVNELSERFAEASPPPSRGARQAPVVAGRPLPGSRAALAGVRSVIFVELGAYLGRSTCMLSWLARGTPITVHVVDNWGLVPLVRPHTENEKGAVVLEARLATAGDEAREDDTVSHLIDDSRTVVEQGKGHFLLAFAANVQSVGHWGSVGEVLHGSPRDSSLIERYADGSVAFIFVDKCRRGRRVELDRWWYKVRPGGRMCGDDARQPGVRKLVKSLVGPPGGELSWPLGGSHWCSTRRHVGHEDFNV